MTAPRARWRLERHRGDAAELHGLGPPPDPERVVRVQAVERAAVVLGSTQGGDQLDDRRLAASGLEMARRRSGGGAVLLVPGEHVWVDLFVPRGDPLWVDDVVAAAHWVGDAWVRALGSLGVVDTSVHRGGADDSEWSRLVCFAGRGPGEVFAGARKLVGVSQRRTREWILAQTVVHLRWDPARLLEVLAVDPSSYAELERLLADAVATVPAPTTGTDREAGVVDALVTALPD